MPRQMRTRATRTRAHTCSNSVRQIAPSTACTYPALDDLACAQLERNSARVKLLAVLGQLACVVDLDDVTGACSRSLARVDVGNLKAVTKDLP